jgi:restriction endonuclease Mrr
MSPSHFLEPISKHLTFAVKLIAFKAIKKFSPNNNITVMKVQQMLGAVHAYNADGGLIITSSGYTNSARDFAYKCSPPIDLLDIGDLVNGKIKQIYL